MHGSAELSLTAVDRFEGGYVMKSTLVSFHRFGWRVNSVFNDSTFQLVLSDGQVRSTRFGLDAEHHKAWIPDVTDLVPDASKYLKSHLLFSILSMVQIGGIRFQAPGERTFATEGGLANLVSALNPRKKLAIGARWESGGASDGLNIEFFGVTVRNGVRLAKLKIDPQVPPDLMSPLFATLELDTGVLRSLTLPRAGAPPMSITLKLEPSPPKNRP
jgi:hypothetical protein